MDASQVTCGTFLNRIANCLGVKVSKGTAREFISFHLSTHQVLLVSDNAETFLEALADRDAAEIATIIDGFGSLSSVTLMLTTRSRSLPPNLLCNHITVLPLSNVPLGITVYHDSIPQAVVHKLLSALDFTPTFHKSAGWGCRAKSVVASRSGGGLGTGEDLSFGQGARKGPKPCGDHQVVSQLSFCPSAGGLGSLFIADSRFSASWNGQEEFDSAASKCYWCTFRC
jgi:hypothetical protein